VTDTEKAARIEALKWCIHLAQLRKRITTTIRVVKAQDKKLATLRAMLDELLTPAPAPTYRASNEADRV
jgi:hypothetical protein